MPATGRFYILSTVASVFISMTTKTVSLVVIALTSGGGKDLKSRSFLKKRQNSRKNSRAYNDRKMLTVYVKKGGTKHVI